jgi:methylmalonyl-CoA mutase cobalamin-binding subunit
MTRPSADALLPLDLPAGGNVLAEGRRLGERLTCGVSLLCAEHGVTDELAYRRKMQDQGRVMTCMNIGMQDWPQTARALELIHAECERRGFRIDRFNLNMDRRMGLPVEMRAGAAKETGPMLESPDDWYALTHTVPIQAHLGDFMIGSPMGVTNTCAALTAGITYVGNMSQMSWRYPAWGDDVAQMVETVKAIGVMAARRGHAAVHSYLDDGFPAQFRDCSSYIGWALFERHLIENLCGATLALSYGGLTTNPITKTAMTVAIERIRSPEAPGAFYHGTTTAFTAEIERNYAVLGVDMLYSVLAQIHTRSAGTVLPVPVTEAIRIPRWQEIVEAHTIARRVVDDAHRVHDYIDWTSIELIADELVADGTRFCANVLDGLDGAGVDITDPLQILLAVRRLGAVAIENQWGVGQVDHDAVGGYTARKPTDTFNDFAIARDRVLEELRSQPQLEPNGLCCIVGSTDIHEFGMFLVAEAVRALGAELVVAGTSVDPDEFADLALEVAADAVLVSTHNGMALTYAIQLQEELGRRGLNTAVFMGGALNQDVPHEDAPVDVSDQLLARGIYACRDVVEITQGLFKIAAG